MWILIVITLLIGQTTGSKGGSNVGFQEYETAAKCWKATKFVNDTYYNGTAVAMAFCSRK